MTWDTEDVYCTTHTVAKQIRQQFSPKFPHLVAELECFFFFYLLLLFTTDFTLRLLCPVTAMCLSKTWRNWYLTESSDLNCIFFLYPHLWIAPEPTFSRCCCHSVFCVSPQGTTDNTCFIPNPVLYFTYFCTALRRCFSQKCPADILVCFLTFAYGLLCSLVADVLVDLVLTLCVHSCPSTRAQLRSYFSISTFKTGSASARLDRELKWNERTVWFRKVIINNPLSRNYFQHNSQRGHWHNVQYFTVNLKKEEKYT